MGSQVDVGVLPPRPGYGLAFQQVKAAVEQIFSVSVVKVRIVNAKPKRGRYGRRVVIRHAGHKKAIVTLEEGQRLDIFEGV